MSGTSKHFGRIPAGGGALFGTEKSESDNDGEEILCYTGTVMDFHIVCEF